MSDNSDDLSKTYFEYLTSISWLGVNYRRYVLYPVLAYHAKGLTLDVGCGTGEFLKVVKGSLGVDINEYCVLHCQNAGLNVTQMEADVLPFENCLFETIVLENVLEHIEDPKYLLDEIHRVLKPMGRLIIGVPLQKGYKMDADHKIFYDSKILKVVLQSYNLDFKKSFEMPLPGLGRFLNSACLYTVSTKGT